MSQISCNLKTCKGVPRSQMPQKVITCNQITCADLKKKPKRCIDESERRKVCLDPDELKEEEDLDLKKGGDDDKNKKGKDDGKDGKGGKGAKAAAKVDDEDRESKDEDFGDQMVEDEDEDTSLWDMLMALFGNKYAKKLLKALLLFLLGLKISKECAYMLIPMNDYSPWRRPPFRFIC